LFLIFVIVTRGCLKFINLPSQKFQQADKRYSTQRH
jgi:hypothetical protein